MLTWIGATSRSDNDAAHNYNNPVNWAGGVIDDSFAGVTFDDSTTLYLSANHTTGAAGLNLGYSGSADLTFADSNYAGLTPTSPTTTPLKLILGGDITGDFGGSSDETVHFTSAQLDAGGLTRFYTPNGLDRLSFNRLPADGRIVQTADLGSPAVSGSDSYISGAWTLSSTSTGIDTNSDPDASPLGDPANDTAEFVTDALSGFPMFWGNDIRV